MQLVGIKELKNRLTYYLGLIKEGDSIIVTDRGVPVAVLHDLNTIEEKAGVEERLASLAKRKLLRLPVRKKELHPIERLKAKGKPVSETIIEDRR
ncbi:MAG: type II toxin-antitoxin system prevent-host-death family antitoxin [Deltaproteobacteria bacterium]|nr:type II toxin-antitoxin system prevent-host-death family antitoxin [Deltaproteobacteria bacterium]